MRLLGGVLPWLSRFQVVAGRPVGWLEGLRREQLAGLAIQHVDETGAAWMDEQLSWPATVVHIDEDVLHDLVVVPGVVRGRLIGPARLAGVGITREDRRRPFVVARTQIRVPGTGIAGAVEEEI